MTRDITIKPLLNGFVARVGCQEICFTDKQTMLTALSEYYDNPDAVEERFLKRAINRLTPPVPETCQSEGPVNITGQTAREAREDRAREDRARLSGLR